jgi:hypothetical protein
MHAEQGGLLGGGGFIRALQSKIKIYFSPSLQLPTYNGQPPNNTVCIVPQTVRYNKLPCSQARLHGVLDRTSTYETFLGAQYDGKVPYLEKISKMAGQRQKLN